GDRIHGRPDVPELPHLGIQPAHALRHFAHIALHRIHRAHILARVARQIQHDRSYDRDHREDVADIQRPIKPHGVSFRSITSIDRSLPLLVSLSFIERPSTPSANRMMSSDLGTCSSAQIAPKAISARHTMMWPALVSRVPTFIRPPRFPETGWLRPGGGASGPRAACPRLC